MIEKFVFIVKRIGAWGHPNPRNDREYFAQLGLTLDLGGLALGMIHKFPKPKTS